MNFSAQFFANFVNDGLQGQETRRSFNDSEEYDPFWQSAEQRRGSSKPDCSFHSGPCAKDSRIGNGRVGCRSTLICPERLKDFGAEEYLNEDMKVFETSVSEPPEVQLIPEHLRFEDISAAAFKLQQAGIQKAPCTCSRLGALNLLSSLKQDQQRKGVIVAADCSFSMAVAYHAVELLIPVFVVMPACCSPPRLRMYRGYGSVVISYGSRLHQPRQTPGPREQIPVSGGVSLTSEDMCLRRKTGRFRNVVVSSANMELDLVLQCVERALVLDDRVSRFTVQLADWPGDMAKLL
uniref:L-serine deaminase n=1 Tax=Sinocyclocheilus grahami TaxID=75366 RepID=A0A672LX84_SINGR